MYIIAYFSINLIVSCDGATKNTKETKTFNQKCLFQPVASKDSHCRLTTQLTTFAPLVA